jgi:hypothetical protein
MASAIGKQFSLNNLILLLSALQLGWLLWYFYTALGGRRNWSRTCYRSRSSCKSSSWFAKAISIRRCRRG